MKIMTILGTRPEFIRLCLIIKKLDSVLTDKHIIVNTNQNFSPNLSDIFIDQMYDSKLKQVLNLNLAGTFGEQMSILFKKLEIAIKETKPDRFFVLGDTNSSMGGILAKRLGLRVFHLEAGNRCYWDKTPEEVNRRLIDHSSDILMTYSDNSKRILLNEGFKENQVFCVGNPIYEVMNYFRERIDKSLILDYYSIYSHEYFLCTLHRSENIDDESRLRLFLNTLKDISIKGDKQLVLIAHPHLKLCLKKFNIKGFKEYMINPIGFFDFVKLEKNADLVFTDSGTVQEECQILNKKCIVLRESSERWETVENGSCIVTGCNGENIWNAFDYLKNCEIEEKNYDIIDSYHSLNVSDKVVKILLGNHRFIGE
jgi:UDP-N-acetylglucosamine 2-epimerase (non-hydrolysing)